MSDGIVLHDEQGDIVSWNASALRILDLSPEEIAQLRRNSMLGDLTHEDGSPLAASEDPIALTLSTGAPHSDLVVGFRTRSGQRPVDFREYPPAPSLRRRTSLRQSWRTSPILPAERRQNTLSTEAREDSGRWSKRYRTGYGKPTPTGDIPMQVRRCVTFLGYDPTEVLGRRARDFHAPRGCPAGSMQRS